MSLPALLALRSRLSSNPGLIAYFSSHYENPVKHLIGYKAAPSADDFPSICYVAVKSKLSLAKAGEVAVSLVIGVHEEEITGGIFDGVAQLAAIQDLIVGALVPLRLTDELRISMDELLIMGDMSRKHPFHELEIQLVLKSLQAARP